VLTKSMPRPASGAALLLPPPPPMQQQQQPSMAPSAPVLSPYGMQQPGVYAPLLSSPGGGMQMGGLMAHHSPFSAAPPPAMAAGGGGMYWQPAHGAIEQTPAAATAATVGRPSGATEAWLHPA
jgi:hypothetical protein